jgi:hypothetical protein
MQTDDRRECDHRTSDVVEVGSRTLVLMPMADVDEEREWDRILVERGGSTC